MTNTTHTSTHTPKVQASRIALLSAFATVYVVWGSTYLGIRIAIETIPPFTMAALRFLSAGLLLFAGATWHSGTWPRPVHWRSAWIIGTLLLVLGNGLLTWAEQYVASGVAALIVATVPMWMVLLDALRPGGGRPGGGVILGLVLGLIGIAILIGPSATIGEPVHTVGGLVICLAAFSWALGSIYSRTAPQSSSTLQNVGMQMLLGGATLGVVALVAGESVDFGAVSARSAWALTYLSLIGGILSYSAYVWLLKVSTPAKVSTYAYVNPVVAVLLGWAVAGEALGPRVLMASLAVISAVVLITTARSKKSPAKARTTRTTPRMRRAA